MLTIYLAGGCFWGLQKYIDFTPGVLETTVGYANGATEAPTYKEVCGGSGHAETVKVIYDPAIISTEALLERYFEVIDPLSVNRQGEDHGVQYRTGIYYEDKAQEATVKAFAAAKDRALGGQMKVEILPLAGFLPAEEYHQKYLDKNPNGYCHIPRSKLVPVRK
ncbi:MAG: peptide-methionine (S)-S-oxide reductase MsrA [Clostridia bacterium]|nr:peptide-methionine (S)-S-oxide reductase MsrA [Clostridia bacterium]